MKPVHDQDARIPNCHSALSGAASLPATMPRRLLRFTALARWSAALAILLLVGGCQRTLLSHAPASSTGCDADLLGYWVSIGDDGNRDGELEATLSTDCIVSVTEHRKDGPRAWPPVKLASARIAGRDLLWLDAAATNIAFEIEPEAIDRAASVYVFAYQIKGERLTMLPPNHRGLARQIVDGELEGAALVEGRNIVVRLDGETDELAKVLGKRTNFQRKDALRFRRGNPSATP